MALWWLSMKMRFNKVEEDDYFIEHFSRLNPSNIDRVLEGMDVRVTEDMNATLCAPYHETEVLEALKMMQPNKAPGPDGFNPLFFQKFWDVVGKDVSRVVLDLLNGGDMPASLNHTNIVLIPKVANPNNLAAFDLLVCVLLYTSWPLKWSPTG